VLARFDQVIDEERALAFANIKKAAQYYNVNLSETNWHQQMFVRSQTGKKLPQKLSRRKGRAVR
jgi:hypothetical protein